MTKVNKITISGFRGICAKLDLDFQKNGKAQSTILYGANGRGKSSITDAWEWLVTGKIQHLAREGAEEGAYPHMAVADKAGSTYVDAEFSDGAIGTVGLMFNNKRITMPKSRGNLDAARRLIKQPCHIRYGDLTRFVFLRKADRYDALASLMGFVPQMEYQKALRRAQSELESDLRTQDQLLSNAETLFKKHFTLTETDYDSALSSMAKVCIAQGFATETTDQNVRESSNKLKAAVTNDPNSKKLADLQTLETATKTSKAPLNLNGQVADLRGAIAQLKVEQKENLHTQLLVPLFQAADTLLSKIKPTGTCPLCSKRFDGNLKEHVKNELAQMQHLQLLLTKLQTTRNALSEALSGQKGLVASFQEACEAVKPDLLNEFKTAFKVAAKTIDDVVSRLSTLLSFDSTNLTDKLLADLKTEENAASAATISFDAVKTALLNQVRDCKTLLEKNPARVKLVADHQFVADGLALIDNLVAQKSNLETARRVCSGFSMIVDDYVKVCLEDVQKRFDEISVNVKVFFEILEKNTAGLGAPKMKLLTEQDRSVVLEVFFHGTPIYPAHKYLSESQLNSFGLAVFIASATHFNKDCHFLLLDDVVNSFDGYKRPQLIELIKNHLKEHQVVLMTHDRFWRDLLHRHLPTWNRLNFTSYSFGVGPVMSQAKDALERIEEALDKDEADDASGTFARYLEDVMQELCEAFEVEFKFNRRNEYTLDTLIDRFRVRVRDKLKTDHPLTKALEQMFQDNAYRNWSIHCKNPESPIQTDEIRAIVGNWKTILNAVQCQQCFDLLKYDGAGGFRCNCGKSQLNKMA